MKSKKSRIEFSIANPEQAPKDPVERYIWELDHGHGNAVNMTRKESRAWNRLKEWLGISPYSKDSPPKRGAVN